MRISPRNSIAPTSPIRVTSATPFSSALSGGNAVRVYFSGDALYTSGAAKQIKGGFFTDQQSNFFSSINGGAFEYFFAMSGGSVDYEGITYGTRAQYEAQLGTALTITISTVGQSAGFDGVNTINGQIMQLEVVPEPSTYALLALGAAALGAYQWRRRRRAN